MTTIQWWRSWHGAPTDTKWLLIGMVAKAPPGAVSAVAWALFDHASQHANRGCVAGFDHETYAAFAGFEHAQVKAILAAMVAKGVIVGDRLAAWEKRQPKREDTSSTERVRKHRDRNAVKHTETQMSTPAAAVTPSPALVTIPSRAEDSEVDKDSEVEKKKVESSPELTSEPSLLDSTRGTHRPTKPSAGSLSDLNFDEWYRRYPHKVGKAAAQKAFESIRKKRLVTQADLMAGLNRYIVDKPDDQKWCNPATWLNEHRWGDEPAPVVEQSRSRNGVVPFRSKAAPRIASEIPVIDAALRQRLLNGFRHRHEWDRSVYGPSPMERGCAIERKYILEAGLTPAPLIVNGELWDTSPSKPSIEPRQEETL